jgi:MoaA/NifB/PqqE/SkfB family radical SAM enzyme
VDQQSDTLRRLLPLNNGSDAETVERSAEVYDTYLALNRITGLQAQGYYPKSFSKPLGFQLELTTRCNLRCKHCYNASGGSAQNDLPSDLWDRVVDEIAAMEPFQIIISGGEPLLLGERLFRIMDRLADEPTRFILITNGWYADSATISRLCRYRYYWMQVSIDGDRPASHDAFRGVQGSWERAVRAAYEIAARGKPLVIAHSVHPDNVESLPTMIDLAAILGATRIVADEVMPVGRAWQSRESIRLTEEQRHFMAEVIYSKQQEYRNRMEVLRTSDPANSFALNLASPCSVLLIRPNGDVKLDCVLPFVIGNVRHQKVADIWESVGKEAWKHPRVQAFVNDYMSTGDFEACEARPYVQEDIYLEAI